MADLSIQFRVPEDVVVRRLFRTDDIRIERDAEIAEPNDDGIQRITHPVRIKMRVLIEEVAHVVRVGIHRLDIACFLEQFHELTIGQHEIVSARRRLRDQGKHVVPARVILCLDLDVVHGLELFHHVRLAVSVPGDHVEFSRSVGTRRYQDQGHAECACCGNSARAFNNLAPAWIGLRYLCF